MEFFDNTRKPVGTGGKMMVSMMNFGHRALAEWGFRFLELKTSAKILDCGCGGGANIRKLLNKHPQGSVTGIDYSPVSVEKSRKLNTKAIEEGRCRISRYSDSQKSKRLALRDRAEMRKHHVEESNRISKKGNEQALPGKRDFQTSEHRLGR